MKKINANYFIRHMEVGILLETFLVMAVLALVGVRTFLFLFDYPKIATETLHIAHALWGGILLLGGLLLSIIFINREARYAGAVVGGLGFGIFIDQLGKFLTHDADYFFQPTFAIIYILFLFLFYIFKAVEKSVPPTSQEYIVNAVEILKDAITHDLDVDEKKKALDLLRRSNRDDQVAQNIYSLADSIQPKKHLKQGLYARAKTRLRFIYLRLVNNRFFNTAVITFFSLSSLIAVVLSMSDGLQQNLWGWGMRISAFGTIILVILGLSWLLRKDYKKGFEWLRISVLFSLFFFQFFLFYFNPVIAFVGLILNIMTLLILSYAITQESKNLLARPTSEPYRLFRKVVKTFISIPTK